MSSTPKLFSVAAACALLLPLASAASPMPSGGSYWDTVPLPTGIVTPPTAKGTLVFMQDGTDVHLYSGITREWSLLPASPTATIAGFNAYAVVEDGNQIHGYATRRGVVDTIDVSASAQVFHGSPTSSWVSIVQDGPLVWGFSGFLGEWEPIVLLGSTPTVKCSQMVGIVHDNVSAFGFSAYTGTWSQTSADASAAPDAMGVTAIAPSPGVVRAYSGHTGEWSIQDFADTSSPIMDRGYVLFVDGASSLAFSGYSGTFASHEASAPGFTLETTRNVVAIVDGDSVTGYAAGVGRFSTRSIPSPVLTMDREVFLASNGAEVHAFSGVTGTFAAPLAGSYTLSTNEAVAFASSPSESHGYSPIKNSWTQAPNVAEVTPAHLARSSVVLSHAGGYEAFASRHGNWVSQATVQANNFIAPGSAAVFAAIDGVNDELVHSWDSRINRWVTATTAGSSQVAAFRTVILAQDSATAYGFGMMNNIWSEVQIQGAVQLTKASSSIGIIETDTHLHTFTAHGSLSSLSRWPEFSRFQPQSTPLPTILSAAPGSKVAYLVSLGAGGGPLAPYGNVFIDLSTAWLLNFIPTVPASGLLNLPIALPNSPALTGFAPNMQCFVVPPVGTQYLTNSISPVLF